MQNYEKKITQMVFYIDQSASNGSNTAANGVYMIRLVNGDIVKTQKVVVK